MCDHHTWITYKFGRIAFIWHSSDTHDYSPARTLREESTGTIACWLALGDLTCGFAPQAARW